MRRGKLISRTFGIAIVFLLIVAVLAPLFPLGVSDKNQISAQEGISHIIVHALNSEGIEIASIEGMDPYCVEIYDGDTLIGYGAHDNETYNKPIAISPGAHTIRVKFNGMVSEENINIQSGETKIITSEFSRISTNIELEYAGSASVSGAWSLPGGEQLQLYTDIDEDRGLFLIQCPLYVWLAPEAGHSEGTYSISGSYSIKLNGDFDLDLEADCTRSGGPFVEYQCYTSIRLVTMDSAASINIPPQDSFTDWYIQYNIDGTYPGARVNYFGGTDIPDVSSVEFIKYDSDAGQAIQGYNVNLLPASLSYTNLQFLWNCFFVCGIRFCQIHIGYGYDKNSVSESGSMDGLKISSVPYDLTGTGIKGLPVASFKLLMECESELFDLENPMVGGKVIFDASDSYDPDGGEILNYQWDFGDGTVINTPSPDYDPDREDVIYHVYQSPEEYTIKLTVTDDEWEIDWGYMILDLTLEVGDLLLWRSAWSGVPGEWTHIGMYAGIVNGQHSVVEARKLMSMDVYDHNVSGVHLYPLTDWSYSNDTTYVMATRVNTDLATRIAAVDFAESKEGQPYDTWSIFFNKKQANGNRWYCSELVWAAYLAASNGQINLDGYEHPIATEVVSPDEIALFSPHMEMIGEHKEIRPATIYTWAWDLLFGGAVYCPVDLIITDPDGLILSKQGSEIPGATYEEIDIDEDGELDDLFTIPERKIGDYLIQIIGESDASPTDTYSFEVSAGGETILLADNAQLGDIPSQGYIVRSTETEIRQIIPPEGCFIATAAYDTPMAEEIQILREFRDEYLLTNLLGQAFVDFYYKVSPPIAEFITDHPSLKPIVRVGLLPAVAMSTVVVNTTVGEKMIILGLLVFVSVVVAIWVIKRQSRDSKYT